MIAIKNYHKGLCFIIFSAMAFGVMPIFAKFAYGGGISAPALLSLRFIMAGLLLFIYLKISKINWRVSYKDLWNLFLLGGVFYSATSIFYFSSIKYIHISLTVLLMYTHPMMVAILSAIFNKERVTLKMVIAMLIAFIGLALILGDSFATRLSSLGITLAIASAISYSLYIFVSSRVVKAVQSIVATAYISVFASFGMLIIGLFQRDLIFKLNKTVIPPLLGLIFICTILAILFFLRGVEILGPTKATIISMFEPVFAAGFSLTLFKEKLTFLQLTGGILVLCGALMVIALKGYDIEDVHESANA
ncbi:DMT family transporter [Alkaliphilus serpentinus]|uniref:DMT family transporter n=1 Tax=Alkaliphilus serpentinus TaxID=1482731 RepID=A0A833M974_9FIRM|nr:DMT family transporter [Alkaliphilus serpentinus]KAB3532797.1 DMT family transporter [Alkaliphilus serpentinus]